MMTRDMTEAQRVGLVRNALLVAGTEMGENGEHWPIINDTIHSIARCWEESRVQQNVDAELKLHLYEQLEIMERNVGGCPAEAQSALTAKLKTLREIYDSYFSSLDEQAVMPVEDEDMPIYLQRAKAIIETLEEGDE